MKKRILVTGFSGVGKSTITLKLRDQGYTAYDLDDMPGLFIALHKGTGKQMEYWDTADLETVKNFQWMCDKEKLQTIMDRDPAETVFYCGAATNIVDLIDLFDVVILLVASPPVLRHRLTTRTNNTWGKTKEVQDYILLERKDDRPEILKQAGAIVIDAAQPIDDVVKEILQQFVSNTV